MTIRRDWLVVAVVALVAAAAGYGYNVWRSGSQAAPPQSVATLMATRLPDLDGRSRPLDEWRGKVVVVNFWATWCAPCRDEIPLFVRLQKKYGERGLQFVGIAVDQPAKIRPFAAELGMNFPILIGGADVIELTRKLGNRAAVLPFTLVMSREGKVVEAHVGIAREAKLEPLLASLL